MICRLCLCKPRTAHSLLEKQNFDMLEALTSIQVSPSDFSTITCTKCLYETRLAYKIQQKILRSNEILGKSNNDPLETVSVKTEPLEPLEFVALNFESLKKCTICSTAVEESLLLPHIKAHFEKPQSCDLCDDEIFENMIEYKKHWNELHKNEGNCKCTDCGSTFRYRCMFLLHRREAHPSSQKKLKQKIIKLGNMENDENGSDESNCLSSSIHREQDLQKEFFTCGTCQKQFTTEKQLISHSIVHKKKTCPICSAEITSYNFNKHVSNHNSGPQVCDICGSVLSSLESLRGHMSHTHSTFRKACEECGREFHKRYPYQLHMKKHKGEKQHVCESCGKSFYTIFTLNKHTKMTHLKLRPHVCSYCQKAFSSRFALKTHVRQHTMEAPYKCEVCGEGFRQNVSLRAHRKSKHNIVEAKTCKCTVCGKEFASEHAVQSHMRLHE